MGYYYTVALVLRAEKNDLFVPLLNDLPQDCGYASPKMANYTIDHFRLEAKNGSSAVYLAEGTEWKHDHPCRVLVENFLLNLQNLDYYYVVLGEEPGDVTCKGSIELQHDWGLSIQWKIDTSELYDLETRL